MLKQNTFFFKLLACFFLLSISGLVISQEDFRLRESNRNATTTTMEDIQTEIKFGQDVAARVLGRIPLYRNQKLTRYVALVGKAVAMYSSRNEIEFHFAVLDSDHANAYSAPGGYVFITRGALSLMQDEAELAAVLAHEIAHITEKHIVKEFKIKGKDSSQLSGMSRMLGGGSDTARVAFFQAVDQAVKILFETGFKQQDELDADRVATLLLASTNYDPMALKRYLKRIKDNHNQENQKKSTHPATTARLTSLDQVLNDEGLTNVDFPRAQNRFNQYGKL
ncbi:MAG: M48 family metalloprotease [Gammaproteobacteria bacterium]|nr:M48 family metalloprotease [Gammaproteobacteria bacterium]